MPPMGTSRLATHGGSRVVQFARSRRLCGARQRQDAELREGRRRRVAQVLVLAVDERGSEGQVKVVRDVLLRLGDGLDGDEHGYRALDEDGGALALTMRPAIAPASLKASVEAFAESALSSSAAASLTRASALSRTSATLEPSRSPDSKMGLTVMSAVPSACAWRRAMAIAFTAGLIAAGPIAVTDGAVDASRITCWMARATLCGLLSEDTLSDG